MTFERVRWLVERTSGLYTEEMWAPLWGGPVRITVTSPNGVTRVEGVLRGFEIRDGGRRVSLEVDVTPDEITGALLRNCKYFETFICEKKESNDL